MPTQPIQDQARRLAEVQNRAGTARTAKTPGAGTIVRTPGVTAPQAPGPQSFGREPGRAKQGYSRSNPNGGGVTGGAGTVNVGVNTTPAPSPTPSSPALTRSVDGPISVSALREAAAKLRGQQEASQAAADVRKRFNTDSAFAEADMRAAGVDPDQIRRMREFGFGTGSGYQMLPSLASMGMSMSQLPAHMLGTVNPNNIADQAQRLMAIERGAGSNLFGGRFGFARAW